MAFDKFKSPRVGSAPKEYEISYFNQLARALDNFFANFDSKAGINVDSLSTSVLITPFAKDPISGLASITVAATNNNLLVPSVTFLRVNPSPAGAFSISGFLTNNAVKNTSSVVTFAAADGQQLVVVNPTANNMTIKDQSASSDAPNRIITNTGADIVTTGSGVVSLIYSRADARWVVTSYQG
jgi:hypothetical protein